MGRIGVAQHRSRGDRQIEARRNLACGRLDRGLDGVRPRGEARHRGRNAERMPASVDMPSRRNAPRLPGARADLIAGDQCDKQIAETDVVRRAQREQRGDDRQPRPAMRGRVAFARFVPTGGRGTQRREAGRAKLDVRRRPGGVAGEGKPQGLPKLPHLRVTQPRQQAAERIEQQQPGFGVDLGRERIESGPATPPRPTGSRRIQRPRTFNPPPPAPTGNRRRTRFRSR